MNNNLAKFCWLLLVITFIGNTGCKKLISQDTPKNQLTTDKVYADASSINAAAVDIYSLFDKTIDGNYNRFLSSYTDEMVYSGPTQDYIDYSQSHVSGLNATNANFWKNSYFAIYQCNDLIEQISKTNVLTSADVNDYIGEAKFLRAYAYFYLVCTYDHVPLVTTTDVNVNKSISQADSATVFQQIVLDLQSARELLPVTYRGTGKVRANHYAASALLARVYLWQHNWQAAEAMATEIISSGIFTPLPTPANVFLANSKETILAFWTQNGFITDGPNLSPSSGAPFYFYTPQQLGAYEAGDLRRTNWFKSVTVGTTTYAYSYKYHNRTANTAAPEYLIALRASEQYLIRAEARAQQNKLAGSDGAIADLNVIRTRSGLLNINATTDVPTVLAMIRHERQVELNTEWGNRYLDLKRWGLLNTILTSLKTAWKPTARILPIPTTELSTDPNLKQNDGY